MSRLGVSYMGIGVLFLKSNNMELVFAIMYHNIHKLNKVALKYVIFIGVKLESI